MTNTATPSETTLSLDFIDFSSLPTALCDNLRNQGITTPTPIQARAIPAAIGGRDLLAQSETGSGKTLAFGLPLAVLLSKREQRQQVGALVLTPTRELATQVSRVLGTTLSAIKLRTLPITGGASYQRQKRALSEGVDIVVGTPGRICDLIDQDVLKLENIQVLVLDEVDQMLDVGFADELEKIRSKVTSSTQTLFFSATLSSEIRALARGLLKNPVELLVDSRQAQAPVTIAHSYLEVRNGAEGRALINALMYHNPEQALIFCKTRQECADLTESLGSRGFNAAALHGDLTQQERNATLDKFRGKKLQYLVATNVAARGIDLQALPLVVNFNVPFDVESYTHRVGRTGRNGATGNAWTIVTPQTTRSYEFIMRRMKLKPTCLPIPGASEILHRSAQQHIDSLKNSQRDSMNRTIEKATSRTLEKLTAEEKEQILREALARHLERLETYYNDDIVCARSLVRLDLKPWTPEKPQGKPFSRGKPFNRGAQFGKGKPFSRETQFGKGKSFGQETQFGKGKSFSKQKGSERFPSP